MMSLNKRKRGSMEIVPMNKNAFKKLIVALEKIKSLHPLFEPYLEKAMVAKYCTRTHDLHLQGEVIDKAYYISTGFMVAYYINEDGNSHVLRIYSAGDIVAGNSFMNAVPATYYLKIYKDSYVLEISNRQMQTGYETIPGMDELARLTLASFEQKEVDRDERIRKGGEECILDFYKSRLELLPPGKIITDPFIASNLHMSDDSLQRFRSALIRKGLLPDKKR